MENDKTQGPSEEVASSPQETFRNEHFAIGITVGHGEETNFVPWTPSTPAHKAPQSSTKGDDSSFNLFSHSFDSIVDGSPAENISRRASISNDTSTYFSPDGKRQHGAVASGRQSIYSFEDLSPIKMDYSSGTARIANAPGHTSLAPRLSLHVDSDWAASKPDREEKGESNPLSVLRSARLAFRGCKYILPYVRIDGCALRAADQGNNRQLAVREDLYHDINLKRAVRRVEAAICAFGGNLRGSSTNTESIFRPKVISPTRQNYETELFKRFELSPSFSHIYWDVEENPPVTTDSDTLSDSSSNKRLKTGDGSMKSATMDSSSIQEELKVKYRCKLCGQLKQNHRCPHQQSLQRDIGVMVYPAVNSYTANEPGSIAQPLTQMNNFVSYARQPEYCKIVSDCPTPSNLPAVTPESWTTHHSPQSSLSATSGEARNAHRSRNQSDETFPTCTTAEATVSTGGKRNQVSHFVDTVSLRPEHYRSVSRDENPSPTAYEYPPIPLTFSERKKLSDTLFLLTQDVQPFTNDCAILLRRAREANEWDLAMAELLTQVVVGLYCGEGDIQLLGLRDYLLALGVSC